MQAMRTEDEVLKRRFVNTVEALRGMRRMSYRQLADGAGVTRQTLDHYLKRTGMPHLPLIEGLARALHVDAYILMWDARDAQRWVLDHPVTEDPGDEVTPVTEDGTPGYHPPIEHAA